MLTWTPAPAWVAAVQPIAGMPTVAPVVETTTHAPAAAAESDDHAPRVVWAAADLQAALRAASDAPETHSVTKRAPHLVFQLSPALPNWDGRPGRYAARCSQHPYYTLTPTRKSANTWRDTAPNWCPACIG